LKTNPRKKWPQFLCNTLFVENKNVTELISDFYFYFYLQFLFLVEYFRIILENVQHYFRYIFSFISDFFLFQLVSTVWNVCNILGAAPEM